MDPNTKLGPYRITEPLGAGGMGEVYLAEDTRLGRQVAIKVLPAEFAADPERLARFEQETRAAAALNHPNIAIIHDVGAEAGADGQITHFMVQEYLEGETLRDRLEMGPLPLRETAEIAGQLARGLARAHAAGIVHRDLKPENLFLTADGAKILDFGLAKLTEMSPVSSDGSATMSPTVVGTTVGQLMGTAGYMAPEQVRGETVDHRADLFAFGCVLHEMLTGHRAFAGRTVHATLDIILHDEPEGPTALGIAVPARMEWVRAKCLAKELNRRYQHADELAVDLARFAEDLSSGNLEVASAIVPAAPAVRPGLVAVLTSVPGMALLVLTAAAAAWALLGQAGSGLGSAAVPDPVPVTQFTTAVTGAAISPNGQMLAFMVSEPQTTNSQIWVKTLPDGQPQQLTRSPTVKDMPAFSPDGSRIAYTVLNDAWQWDTWVVPIVGGAPRLMLRNANSLTWTPDGRVIFSEFREGFQLAIVMADESGGNREDVWVPLSHQMAHYSQVSPDGTRVLIGYMGPGPYAPAPVACFERTLDGTDADVRIIGGDLGCNLAARYSADGAWIYFVADNNDLMREPAGGGPAEMVFDGSREMNPNVGFGAFALAPSGDAVFLAAGSSSRNIWRHDPSGFREQVTYQGAADHAVFSRDRRYLFYLLDPGQLDVSPRGQRVSGTPVSSASDGEQIWRYDSQTQQHERVCAGMVGDGFAVSPDGLSLIVEVEAANAQQLWTCALDGAEPSRRLVESDLMQTSPLFSPDGTIVYFVQMVDASDPTQGFTADDLNEADDAGLLDRGGALYRVNFDGTDARQISPALAPSSFNGVSPDGSMLSVTHRFVTPTENWLFPVDGGEPRLLMYTWDLMWAPDGSSFLFSNRGMVSNSWILENPAGDILPRGLPQAPGSDWFAEAGARHALIGIFFSEPVLSTQPHEIAYRRVDFRSNLYRQEIPQ